MWQVLAYVLVTAGEVLISVTSLAFFYTQAPRKMKSAIMSIKMFAVSLGNLVTAGVNFLIMRPDGSSSLEGANYFLFFVGLMLVTGLLFIPMAKRYEVQSYMQDHEGDGDASDDSEEPSSSDASVSGSGPSDDCLLYTSDAADE